MLRFIVLGEIPGTHLVITFTWVLVLAAVFFTTWEIAIIVVRYRRQHGASTVLPKITQKLAEYSGHIVAALRANTVFPAISRVVRKVRSNV